MTRGYEALFILKTTGSEQDTAKTASQAETLVKKFDGAIEHSQSMGRRRLAFRIGRQTEGFYHVVRFAAPPERVRELERQLRLQEGILRFMVVSQDETRAPEPAVAAAQASP